METLPQDIVDHIVSYLLPKDFYKPRKPYAKRKRPSQPLAPLATLSHRLQAAVERLTFRHIKVTSEELAEFGRLFTPARRGLLSNLIFTVILPPYDDAATLRAESPEERAANDRAYTKAIQSLFQFLGSWEKDDLRIVGSLLILSINHPESPSDFPWPSRVAPWGRGHVNEHEQTCIHEGRYLHSYINLLHPESLPVLHRVRKLEMVQPEDRYGHRNVYPKVPIVLASKMANLEAIKICVDDDEKRFPHLRRRNRDEAAHAIRELSLPELKSVDMTFFSRRYRNERVSLPMLHEPGAPDPISSAICDLSLNLVDLEVTGVFDLSVLQPLQGLSETTWPRLKFLDVNIHASTPSGGWYFTHRHATSISTYTTLLPMMPYHESNLHQEQFSFDNEAEYASMIPNDVFRGKASDEALVPFIEAFADALSVMPKLTSAAFNCLLEDDSFDGDPGWFNITFFAPCGGAKKHPPKMQCPNCNRTDTRQLITMFLGWEPSEELAERLRRIQDAFHTEPMIEKDMIAFLKEHDMD
ncbi:hypothetical protein ACJ41O_006122 [Fusarium nematophilum]